MVRAALAVALPSQQKMTPPNINPGKASFVQRKDRVYEALQSLCAQRPAQQSVLRRDTGFSAEEVAELAAIDRTNASRDLNKLAQEGIIERIPGRPVLFTLKSIHDTTTQNNHHEPTVTQPINSTEKKPVSIKSPAPPPAVSTAAQISTS